VINADHLKAIMDQNTADAANVVISGVMAMIETLPAVVDTGGSYEDGYLDALTDVGSSLVRLQRQIAASYQHEN
jgi:hypothetical protein